MNRNKKTLYSAIGVLIALLVIFLVWGASKSRQSAPQESSTALQTESESAQDDGHAGMNHDGMGTSATGDLDLEDSGYDEYMQEENAIMNRMMHDMELTEDTGNAAVDFLTGMIPHHEAAVEMAESYLTHGGNHEMLKPLAESIITTQKEEITQMQDILKELLASGKKDQAQADAYREKYDQMMSMHHAGHGSTGQDKSLDTAFASGMLMHHQMAVEMAEGILDHTDEEAVTNLAKQIIEAQDHEIALMQEVLDQQ